MKQDSSVVSIYKLIALNVWNYNEIKYNQIKSINNLLYYLL